VGYGDTMPAQYMNRAVDGTALLSPQARARLARMRRATDSTEGGDLPLPDLSDLTAVAAWRRSQHERWGEGTIEDEPPHQEIVTGGVPTLWAGPSTGAGDTAPAALLYFHGGGFCLGSPGTAAPITARLARPDRHGRALTVVSVGYRLAPEYPYPAALDDAERVASTLLDGWRLVLGGDSAGAALAFALWQRLAGRNVEALLGFSPLLDLRHRRHSDVEPLLAAYVGRSDPGDPLISPAAMDDATLARLPAVLVQTSAAEAVHPTVAGLVARAEEAGVPILHQVWDGLWHAWHYHRELPEAWAAVDGAADFVRRRLGVAGTRATRRP
jgi:epsilon-lactone hydrolase